MKNYTKNKTKRKVNNKVTIETLTKKLIKNSSLSKKEHEQLSKQHNWRIR